MKFLLKSLLILFLLFSCRFSINSNNNGSKDFSTSLPIVKFNINDLSIYQPYQYVELKKTDIKEIVNKQKYCIIYLFSPWCGPCIKDFSLNIPIIFSLMKKAEREIFILNNAYGFEKTIEKKYRQTNVISPIFVLDKDVYKNDIQTNTTDFFGEFINPYIPHSTGMFIIINSQTKIVYFNNNLGKDFLKDTTVIKEKVMNLN